MKKFNSFLIEQTNTHMEHIEDMVFNDGVAGARLAINSLRQLRDMLAGNSTRAVDITVKWDGAPAIFIGVDPADGKFFVAKKGLFNKVPQVFKSAGDIDRELSGDLATKFKYALSEFAKLGLKSGVVQGDLMFTKGDIKSTTYAGKQYYTFQPNTIVYAVEKDSALGKTIKAANIGVVWHTTYTGNDLKNLRASFGQSIVNRLKPVSTVWMDDATFKDQSGKATFTASETKVITSHLSNAGRIFRSLPADFLQYISEDQEAKMRIKAFLNTFVRQGEPFPNARVMAAKLVDYVQTYYNKQMEGKGERGRATQQAKLDRVTKAMSRSNEMIALFEFFNEIVQAKLMVVNKLHQAEGLATFIRTRNGLKVTDREGYVAIDHLDGGAVKLVDRLEFSKANFSSDVLKGWEK